MNSTPSASPASKTGMMCGSSTAAAACDSRMKPLLEGLVRGQSRGEDLQRYQPAQPLIARTEHHGHPALADLSSSR